jgi:hypothetical protein
MSENLNFQENTIRLLARENIINIQHRESFKFYIGKKLIYL